MILRFLAAAVLVLGTTPAQIPSSNCTAPPVGYRDVGIVLRRQPAHVNQPGPVDGSEVFGLFAEPTDVVLPTVGLGSEIIKGNYLWMFAGSVHLNLLTGLLEMTSNTGLNHYFHFFALSVLSGNSYPLPFSVPGHDVLFSDHILMMPPDVSIDNLTTNGWVMTQDMQGVVIPPTWTATFRCLCIPNNPALVGMPYSAQSIRLEGVAQSFLYASDEIAFTIS